MNAQEIIEVIKKALEKEEGVRVCHKFQADKVLQIQLKNGESFNLCIVKLGKKKSHNKKKSLIPSI